jgi:hypothetical protein
MAEKKILFEAGAATPFAHQLLLQRWLVETNRPSQERIQVLERDGERAGNAPRRAVSGVAVREPV